jgi:hypothetical protein
MTTGSSDAPHACAAARPDSIGAANCRSRRYLIARALLRCPHCARIAPVVGLMLPAGHETLVDSGNSDAQHWVTVSCPALLFFIEQFPERVGSRLQQLSPHYWPDLECGAAQPYWMNHCASCGCRHCDTELYCELDGAFAPLCAGAGAEWEGACLLPVSEPCEARASGYAYVVSRHADRY